MSTHIGAKAGEIAKTVILPGDPLRAKMVAETYLEKPECFSTLRNMLGYTGYYKGKRISVMGTGMGVPSISIYVTELINDYGAENLIRMGTAGALSADVPLRTVLLAMTASTDSAVNTRIFEGASYAPAADFSLLSAASEKAAELGLSVMCGNVLTSDSFYQYGGGMMERWAEFGVLAVEMETAALYTIAARYRRRAVSVLTVSDNVATGEAMPMIDRQESLRDMAVLSLETAAVFAK